MLGCVLVLLIISSFVQTPYYFTPEPNLFRQARLMPEALRDDALRLVVTRDGSIYFGNIKTSARDLPELIRKRLRSGAQRKVFLVVDTRAQYGDLSEALNGVLYAGIQDIAFLAESPFLHK